MKKYLAIAVAAAALMTAAPAAAQSWQSINQRQDRLDDRIDTGVRNGSLTRNEAVRLRAEFNDLVRLEARYRSSNGLSGNERADLDRRFDSLSQRIRVERNDRDDRGWQSINQRQRQIDARIDLGVQRGFISRREAVGLRGQFNEIARLEVQYRRNGLNQAERRDLDRRFDRLSATVEAELRDRDRRRG